MSEIKTKPSKAYSKNFENIFGKQPAVAKTRRRYFVYDSSKGKTVEAHEKPRPPRLIGWPMASDALGVLPKQVKDATEAAAKSGVPTEFDPKTGQAILRDPHHRKRLAESLGMYDLNGGYSDPQQHKERFTEFDRDPTSDYDGI